MGSNVSFLLGYTPFQKGDKTMLTRVVSLKCITLSTEIVLLRFNPFTPEFPRWILPSLNLDSSTDANRGFSLKSETEWQSV